jgi:putative phage-type endonuclease
MKQENEQSGIDWHKFRQQGVGSSDVPVLMGYTEYHTPYSLYLEKISKKVKDRESNFIQERGHQMEPIAREKFNIIACKDFVPKRVERENGPYRVSLDGDNSETNEIIEIKYVGKDFNAEPPKHHLWQMQYQLLVSGAVRCYYVQINDKKEINHMVIVPDMVLQADIQEKVLAFWKCVTEKTPPPICKDDTLPMSKEKAKQVRQVLAWKAKIKLLEAKIEPLEAEILKDVERVSYQRGKYKITYSEKAGSIEYSKIPELKSVDLESYRKSKTRSWSIKQVKV